MYNTNLSFYTSHISQILGFRQSVDSIVPFFCI